MSKTIAVGIVLWMAVTSAARRSSETPTFKLAAATCCANPDGSCPACVVGRFERGVPVRIVGGGTSCEPLTGARTAWTHPDMDVPSSPEELARQLTSGEALEATLLERFDGCGSGDVALVGYRGTIQTATAVSVTDAAERKRLAERALSGTAIRDVILRDANNEKAAPDAEPTQVFRIDGRGPTFVRFRSRSDFGVQDGPLVVFEGAKLTTPFELCASDPEPFRAEGRLFFRAETGACETGGVAVVVYEVRGDRLHERFTTSIFAN